MNVHRAQQLIKIDRYRTPLPYPCLGLAGPSAGPPTKRKRGNGVFVVKETWSHEFSVWRTTASHMCPPEVKSSTCKTPDSGRKQSSSTAKTNLSPLPKRWDQFIRNLKTQLALNCWGVCRLTRTSWPLLCWHPGTLFLSYANLQVLGKQWPTLDHYKSF